MGTFVLLILRVLARFHQVRREIQHQFKRQFKRQFQRQWFLLVLQNFDCSMFYWNIIHEQSLVFNRLSSLSFHWTILFGVVLVISRPTRMCFKRFIFNGWGCKWWSQTQPDFGSFWHIVTSWCWSWYSFMRKRVFFTLNWASLYLKVESPFFFSTIRSISEYDGSFCQKH